MSSTEVILLVAWRSKAIRASMGDMPEPSSTIWIKSLPPSRKLTFTVRAPASMAFSIISLTTDAGRLTTSPAAIWLATTSGNNLILSAIYS